MPHSTNVLVESQLDWLTCAAHTERGATTLALLARAWADTTETDVARPTPFRLKGYQGWQRGRVRLGERPGAALIQLSGDLARSHFDTLIPLVDNVSRIDLAATVRLAETDPDVGQRSYAEAVAFYGRHSKAAIPSFHGDADGGYTCYVGDRSSDWFLRIYNKEAESRADLDQARHYERCWRYELEVKGGTANALAGHLLANGPDARAGDVQSMVWEYVHRHGIEPTFDRSTGAKLIPGFRRRSDRDSKLAWLAKSVKPACDWLAETGDSRDVYEALGLPWASDTGE